MKKLELKEISKSFSTGGSDTKILNGINLHVNEGEFVSLIGPSGSGKTTLFHLIGGLIRPSSGQIYMDGKDVTGRKGLVSYMPQQASLFPWRNVEENVIMAREAAGLPKAESLALAREWLDKVGLKGYEKEHPHVLSGGMQQRVSFLRALLSPRELMCLDEPFGALDALTREDMQHWLLKIWEQNKRSVLFITHSLEEALLLSDRIYLLSDKPTRIEREVIVPFERPRALTITEDPAFISMKRELINLMKSVGSGS